MDDLLRSMNQQLSPSDAAMASLRARLEAEKALVETSTAPKKGPMRPHFFRNFGALAACAALLLCAWPVYNALRPAPVQPSPAPSVPSQEPLVSQGVDAPKLHSFVTAETGAIGEYSQEITVATGGGDTGDRDMDMTPDELAQAMGDMGFSQADIDEYQAIGYQMTWAKWWKFVHQQQDSEGGDPFTLSALKAFSQKELPAPAGALPGGAYVGDAAVQEEAAAAYQALMDRFRADYGEDAYPDWYGGSYIDQSGALVISVTQQVSQQADKAFFLKIEDWTGSHRVAFREVKYSLAHLKGLMDRLNALPETDPKCGDVMAGWGVDERANRIELTLTQTNDHILSVLAELDPEDDAILVQVAAGAVTTYDTAPGRVKDLPGGAVIIGEEPVAVEPQVEKKPQPGGLTAAPYPGAVADAVTEPLAEPARTDLDGTVPYGGEPMAVEPQGEPASASEDGQAAQADDAARGLTPAAAVSHDPGVPAELPQSKLPAVVSE